MGDAGIGKTTLVRELWAGSARSRPNLAAHRALPLVRPGHHLRTDRRDRARAPRPARRRPADVSASPRAARDPGPDARSRGTRGPAPAGGARPAAGRHGSRSSRSSSPSDRLSSWSRTCTGPRSPSSTCSKPGSTTYAGRCSTRNRAPELLHGSTRVGRAWRPPRHSGSRRCLDRMPTAWSTSSSRRRCPSPIREVVIERAEGNPFFVEELVRTLIDQGVFERRNGGWTVRDLSVDLVVPGHRSGRPRRAHRPARAGGEGGPAGCRGDRPDVLVGPRLRAGRGLRSRSAPARGARLHPPPLGSSISGEREFAIKHASRARSHTKACRRRARSPARAVRGVARAGRRGRDEHAALLCPPLRRGRPARGRGPRVAGRRGRARALRERAVSLAPPRRRARRRPLRDRRRASLLERAVELEPTRSHRWRSGARSATPTRSTSTARRSRRRCNARSSSPTTSRDGGSLRGARVPDDRSAGMWGVPQADIVDGWIGQALELAPAPRARPRQGTHRSLLLGLRQVARAGHEASGIAERQGVSRCSARTATTSSASDCVRSGRLRRIPRVAATGASRSSTRSTTRITRRTSTQTRSRRPSPAASFDEARRYTAAHDEVTSGSRRTTGSTASPRSSSSTSSRRLGRRGRAAAAGRARRRRERRDSLRRNQRSLLVCALAHATSATTRRRAASSTRPRRTA